MSPMRMRRALTICFVIGFAIWDFAVSPARDSLALTQQAQPRHAPPAPEMRVDINHSTIEELLKIPGMTRTWAGRVVRFRPYRTKQDLLDRGIVTAEIYNRIKDYIIAHREKQ